MILLNIVKQIYCKCKINTFCYLKLRLIENWWSLVWVGLDLQGGAVHPTPPAVLPNVQSEPIGKGGWGVYNIFHPFEFGC